MSTPTRQVVAQRLTVTGVVQGVGFRPFVHRLAVRLGLAGSVANVGGEVEIMLEGEPERLAAFVTALRAEAPALAVIETVSATTVPATGRDRFRVAASRDPVGRRQPVPADAAMCSRCEAELLDPANRRAGYPFVTCTDCGPRHTVIEAMPYDRERTSMRHFRMCARCQAEYDTPGDRRYHSETNSCPACGPTLWLEGPGGTEHRGPAADIISAAARLLAGGAIVAVRGFGGFHLAVDATSPAAVERLRARKRRDAKPLAVMVRTLEEAGTLARIGAVEAAMLRSSARPIVLLPARADGPLAPGVAPGLDTIGVMLPSTPLHHLLLAALDGPLVMTSGNHSEEPIAIGNAEARTRLREIADAFLLHDREIITRYDDSVLRVVSGTPRFLRRARGVAPLPLAVPVPSPMPVLAVGGDLKNTFTLLDGARAYVSQHLGDLADYDTLLHFDETLARYRDLFGVTPAAVVRDLHPGYHSSRIAELHESLPCLAVQHHHAHVAAVLAEHGHTGPAIGIAFDGTGWGDDGTVWGAEILLADLTGYRRLAHLREAALPGGDLAARTPWRAALGYLALDPSLAPSFRLAFTAVAPAVREVAEHQARRGINAPRASSMGRLFDAAAAVLGRPGEIAFEGQAAMELEALAGDRPGRARPFPVHPDGLGGWLLDPLPLLAVLGNERQRGVEIADLAADFHDSIVRATAELIEAACDETGIRVVALGGGVFQNARLLAHLQAALVEAGCTVLVPRRLPPNDGAISYGQAAIAAARLAADHHPTAGGS